MRSAASLHNTLVRPLFPTVVASIFAIVTLPDVHAQPASGTRPSYSAPAPSITVPFAAPVDFSNLAKLKLITSVNGGPANQFTVDTGSVGVVLPAVEIPGFDPHAPENIPGELRYASSGLTLDGFWITAVVRFLDPATQQPRAEAHVQVLAVTQGSCQGGGANAGQCTGTIPHMLGVGFGRGGDSADGMRTQASNPFVNLVAMNGPAPRPAMRHGYLITRSGITFGLTSPETRGFQFVKLIPAAAVSPDRTHLTSAEAQRNSAYGAQQKSLSSRPEAVGRSGETPVFAPAHASTAQPSSAQPFSRDYNTAPGFLTLGTQDFPMGTVLIDTGLTNMIVEESGEPTSGDLRSGQPVTVHLLGSGLSYRFTTGTQTTPAAPRRATWARDAHGPFLNTGLRALACFDYLYDADNGYLGLRPTCTAGPDDGGE